VRMKMKSLIANFNTEVVFKADDKIDQIVLDKKECTYSTTSTKSKPRTWATP